MCNKADRLNLFNIIKANDSDEGSGISSLGLFQFSQYLERVVASKERKFPHGPISAIIVSWATIVLAINHTIEVKFQARNPAFLKEIINLLCNGIWREWWEIGEGFKFDIVHWGPHL